MIRAGTVLLAVLLCGGAVHAQRFDPDAMTEFAAGLFDRMDLDGDGKLSREEHVATHGGGFMVDYELLDLDGSGAVTKEEYLQAVRKYHPPHPRGEPI